MQRIVRSRAGLRVVLDGRPPDVLEGKTFDRAVVQVDMRELGRAVVGLPADRLVFVDRLGSVRPEEAKPWFWLVISTIPVVRSLTG